MNLYLILNSLVIGHSLYFHNEWADTLPLPTEYLTTLRFHLLLSQLFSPACRERGCQQFHSWNMFCCENMLLSMFPNRFHLVSQMKHWVAAGTGLEIQSLGGISAVAQQEPACSSNSCWCLGWNNRSSMVEETNRQESGLHVFFLCLCSCPFDNGPY